MALRLSGGVAHAMAVSVGVIADERAARLDNVDDLCRRSGAQIGPIRPDDLVLFVREIQS